LTYEKVIIYTSFRRVTLTAQKVDTELIQSCWPSGTRVALCRTGLWIPVIRLRLLAISIIRLQLRLRTDSDLQLY